jgi:hypothetical protein
MTVKEVGVIMDILEAAYPQFYKGQRDKDHAKAVKLWSAMFANDSLEIVATAVKAFIVTDAKGFPPTIGIIKNKIADIKNPDEMTEYEAWNLISKAISNGYYGAEEEFEKLPPILQRLVGSPNQLRTWATMTTEHLHTVVSSNLMRSYKSIVSSTREYDMLPEDVKNIVSALSEKFKMPELPKPLTEYEVNERRNEIYKKLEEETV